MALDPARYELLSFDCYGTLVDWEAGLLAGLRPLMPGVGDEAVLEAFARAEAAVEAASNEEDHLRYREVLARVLERIGAEAGFVPAAREALAEGLAAWPLFADTKASLARLGRRYRLAVLSNIDRDLFETTRPRLGVDLDAVVTAEEVGAYKPSPRFFEAAAGRLGVDRERWLHVAQSLYHDVAPARSLGLATVWVDRRQGRPGSGATAPSDAVPDLRVPSLEALCEALAVPPPLE
ncbi:MAG: haloacid dehalogenase type II [Planctomycetota bacterium]